MENYELLLEKAFGGLKPVVFSKGCDRFEIPKADSRVIGNKTVLNNFMHICSCFRRAPEHLCKFLSKELAAFSRIEGERIVFNRKISQSLINEKIALYTERYVFCKECRKPDTELIKQDGLFF